MKPDWEAILQPEMDQPYFRQLMEFVDSEYNSKTIYPPKDSIYAALAFTGYSETRVVILGQDPYHGEKQSHGLCFSIDSQEAKYPPSLRNMFKELEADLGITRTCRNLSDWAKQGVLLLNTVLTVQSGQAASHRGKGWEQFTDAIIRALNRRTKPMIFVLWGGDAKKKIPLIDGDRHKIISAAHPSPLSAHNGFFGSKPYSRINAQLKEWGQPEIIWG